MKTLKDTVDGMLSNDWKERLVAEIEQADIRMYQLAEHMREIGEDSPEYFLLQAQLEHQTAYLYDLMARANAFEIEYTLPSAEEAAKKFNSLFNTPSNDSKTNFNDPMFWTIVLLMLALRKD